MSIKKKIILSFFISFSIIATLAIAAYLDFHETRNEFKYLELAESIRGKTLQLRRHEKNFFLYGDSKEIEFIHKYIEEIKALIKKAKHYARDDNLVKLNGKLSEFSLKFEKITVMASDFHRELNSLKPKEPSYLFLIPIIKATFLEHPLQNAQLLKRFFKISKESRYIILLKGLDVNVKDLRKTGEKITGISKELDSGARKRVQKIINVTKVAVLVFLPISFLIGFILLFYISQNIVNRLKKLMLTIEKSGAGFFSPMPFPSGHDEVSTLIRTYNNMAEALRVREELLKKKEEELIQSKKLAAIGTLASGVAHELTNPLNNIHISAQILAKEMGDDCTGIIKETVDDILGQTLRVKKIVGDLLDFARSKEPDFKEINIVDIIQKTYGQAQKIMAFKDIKFSLESPPEVFLRADPAQLERVFLNLFTNAADAMSGKGELYVRVFPGTDTVKIEVSDTGKGIPSEVMDKIFDPFYTTKDRGTGLGLSIVYNIIKNHTGRVNVKSTAGAGTTFTIFLPRYE
ncbi:sensor protein ZraS [bacterium BMS3Bbin06]|nr:sensor protein ZraS [bacterium BMS3Bbin06]HDH04417.1 sensor histidine kinase [Nitrospirota bacterium]